MTTRLAFSSTFLALGTAALAMACSDEPTNSTSAATTAVQSTSVGVGGATTSAAATGGASTTSSSASGGGMLECFPFSNDVDVPLAIDGVFDATSDTWQRPYDDPPMCPASGLLPENAAHTPYVAYAFCNEDSVAHTYRFEMIATDGPRGELALDDPYLLLYAGIGIPADPLQCLAVNDDIPDALMTTDSEILDITVPAGEAITMVGTTVTFAASEDLGTGYYILVVTNTDG